MSNYFNINPTGGTTGREIEIIPTSNNFTYEDRTTTITVSNGLVSPKTVTVTQYNAPRLVQFGGSQTVQATGGTLYYNFYTHYDFAFRSVPDWVTIRDSKGNVYSEGETIAAGAAYDTTFFIDVQPNTSTNERAVGATFNVGHFIDGVVQQYVNFFSFRQLGREEEKYITTSTSLVTVDYPINSYGSFTVTANTSWTINNTNPTDFSVSPLTGSSGITEVTVTASDSNYTTSNRECNIIISSTESNAQTTLSVLQYNVPRITQFGGSSTVQATGGTLFYSISTHYDFVFRSVPDWVTIYDGKGNYYAQGERIPATRARDNTFYIEVEENTTGSSRSTGSTFNMGHFIGNDLQNRVNYITITQLG